MNGIEFKTERQLRLAWSIMLVANLPVPPLMLLSLTTDLRFRAGTVVGICVGLTAFCLLGFESCRRARWLGPIIIPGGLFVAAAQLCPILHFLAMVVSDEIWYGRDQEFFFSSAPRSLRALDGFVIAVLMGAILVLIAIGIIIHIVIFISRLMPERQRCHRRRTPKRWRHQRGFYADVEVETAVRDA